MNTRLDEVPAEVLAHIDYASEWFDRAVVAAATLERHHDDDESLAMVPYEIRQEVETLAETPPSNNLVVTFSGEGFYPVVDPEGDQCTVYGKIGSRVGRLCGIEIVVPSELEHIDKGAYYIPGFYDDEAETEETSSIASRGLLDIELDDDDRELRQFVASLATPSDQLRVMVRFLLNESENEMEVRGACVVANGVSLYAIVDAAKLAIDDIRVQEEVAVGLEDVIEAADTLSGNFRRLLKSTSFRRMSSRQQKREAEAFIEAANLQLALDRFTAHCNPAYFYEPVVSNENRQLRRFDNDAEHYLAVNLIRVDSLEQFTLSQPKGIRNSASMIDREAGLCVVAQLQNPAAAHRFGLKGNIVWIPISSQDFEMFMHERDMDCA